MGVTESKLQDSDSDASVDPIPLRTLHGKLLGFAEHEGSSTGEISPQPQRIGMSWWEGYDTPPRRLETPPRFDTPPLSKFFLTLLTDP
jgi:hypothetical protein